MPKSKKIKRHTESEKRDAARRVKHGKASISAVAKQFGVSEATIRRWCQEF